MWQMPQKLMWAGPDVGKLSFHNASLQQPGIWSPYETVRMRDLAEGMIEEMPAEMTVVVVRCVSGDNAT